MINPGLDLLLDSLLGLVIPMIFIAFLSPQLLVAPLLFTYRLLLRHSRLHSAAQSGLRRDAHAVRRDERRTGRDDHRHRGG